MSISLEPVVRLGRDIIAALGTLSDEEARFLVDAYYAMQENRIRAAHQVRASKKGGEPHSVLLWAEEQSEVLEKQIARALGEYAENSELGRWALSVVGIGPVITAGLLAHIDIKRASTVGHIWRFAGLDPTSKWEKGQKRPHNASLKTLCWKIGESFVKVKGNERDFYGKKYEERKALEIEKNERLEYAEQAAAVLRVRPQHAQRAIYSEGKLPPGHLHARAKRYAVKLFLAHYWQRGREIAELPVPLPYSIAHLGHAHKIEPQGGSNPGFPA